MTRLYTLCWALVALPLLCAGCIALHKPDELPPPPPDQPLDAVEVYTLACPDLIDVIFLDWPDVSQTARIEPDGCINIGSLGRIRVEGLMAWEAARVIAERAEVSRRKVLVQVVEYSSRQVMLYGEVTGGPRVVDYRGPETVVELLNRSGGLNPQAAPREVHIVRARVGEGIPAETLPVDLEAILEKHDERTNIRIQPLDAIYVGQLPRYRIGKSVPTFLKPIYAAILQFVPTQGKNPDRK